VFAAQNRGSPDVDAVSNHLIIPSSERTENIPVLEWFHPRPSALRHHINIRHRWYFKISGVAVNFCILLQFVTPFISYGDSWSIKFQRRPASHLDSLG
jgi:hypothetical protein